MERLIVDTLVVRLKSQVLVKWNPETAKSLLLRLKTETRYTNSFLAGLMGVPLRTFEDILSDKSALRPVHVRALLFGWANEVPASIE